MINEASVRTLIRARAIAKCKREREQPELLKSHDLHHETIRAALDGRYETTQFWNFAKCGREKIFKTCRGCHTVESFEY